MHNTEIFTLKSIVYDVFKIYNYKTNFSLTFEFFQIVAEKNGENFNNLLAGARFNPIQKRFSTNR